MNLNGVVTELEEGKVVLFTVLYLCTLLGTDRGKGQQQRTETVLMKFLRNVAGCTLKHQTGDIKIESD